MFDISVQRVIELIEDQYRSTMNYDEQSGIRNRVTVSTILAFTVRHELTIWKEHLYANDWYVDL